MSNKRVGVIVRKINNERKATVEENKVRMKLSEIKEQFDKNTLKKIKQMEERFCNV